MREIKVSEICNVDTISKGNSKPWALLIDALKDSTEPTIVDFVGVRVVEPWLTDKFAEFISIDNVKMRVYWDSELYNTIKTYCILNNIKGDKIENIEYEVEAEEPKIDTKVSKMAHEIQDYFVVDEDDATTAALEINKKFSQIASIKTTKYIEEALNIFCDNNPDIKRIIVHVGDSVQSSLIRVLSNIMGNFFTRGVDVDMYSNDKDIMSKLNIYQHLGTGRKLSDAEKIEIIKGQLAYNMAGMLTRYKKSRAVDEFGRQGCGEPVSCRPAIYKGIEENNGETYCLFVSYNGNTFVTNEHWMNMNDNETHSGLEKEEIKIAVSDLGILNSFLGRRYHFSMPIQCDKQDYFTMYSFNENGNSVKTKLSIPERLQVVFDEFGIEYDESSLMYSIIETDRIMNKNK